MIYHTRDIETVSYAPARHLLHPHCAPLEYEGISIAAVAAPIDMKLIDFMIS